MKYARHSKILEIINKNEIETQEELAKTDMPLGLKINAKTPAEIAISILAKLIEVKNKK